ncbi:S26 family signal peptidase [Actinoplanes sp. NPDC051861]|uniref:S26 family signal peptidase n=1 Tax=Actinoplanes sp. NPDC051861 TaxID=3155170 RepID=UPI003449183B
MTTALWAASIGAALVLVGLRTTLLAATVSGQSMQPTLAPGDRILVLRRWLARRPRRDDVVVVRMAVPTRAGMARRLMVKRIGGAHGDRPVFFDQMLLLGPREIFVVGDNPEQSFDSRDFGTLTLDDVVGTMLCRLPRGSHAAG